MDDYIPAEYLAFLPTEESRKLAVYSAQRQTWSSLRLHQQIIAFCWLARHSGEDDPLFPFLETEKITEDYYDFCWIEVEQYDALWALVQRVQPYIKKELAEKDVEWPFPSALDLFYWILREEIDETFALSLTGYLQISTRPLAKSARILAKALENEEISENDLKFVKKANIFLKQGRRTASLHGFVFNFARKKATNRYRALKMAFHRYSDSLQEGFKHSAKLFTSKKSLVMEYGEVTKKGSTRGYSDVT